MAVLGKCTSLLVAAIITMFFIPTIVGQDYCINTELVDATGYSQILTSPNYPDNYPSNRDCLCTIRTASSSQVVVLKLLDFYLEGSSPSCNYDKVTIYNGDSKDSPILGKLCDQQSSRNFKSSGQYLTVAFHSDGSNNFRGFQFEYTSQERTDVSNVTSVTGQCNDLNTLEATEFSKNLTSPNYPVSYTSNRDCLWTIRAASSSQVVVLKLFDFYLEGYSPSCNYDKVTIYDGDSADSFILRKLCGQVSSRNVTSSGQYMTVAFHSDRTNNYRGFKFEYTSQEKTVAAGCANVDLRADPDVESKITSPNYPNAPPGGADCQWHISSSSYSSVVVLEVNLLGLGGSQPDCTSDYVKIYDGSDTYSSLIQVLCGSLNSRKFVSTGSHMTIVFHLTGVNSGYGYTGFRFTYYSQVPQEPQATISINWKDTDSDSGDTYSESYRKKYVDYISIRVGCTLGGALLSVVLGLFCVRVRRQRLQREAQRLRARDNSMFVSGAVANNPVATAPYVITENSQNTSNPPAYPGLNSNVNGGLPNYTPSPPAYSVNPNQHQDCLDMPGWSAQQEPAPLLDDPRQETPYPKGEINFAHSDVVMRDDMNASGDAK